jgi:hypothetical protein
MKIESDLIVILNICFVKVSKDFSQQFKVKFRSEIEKYRSEEERN